MTKRIVASVILVIIVLCVSWYGYQEYKKSQNIVEIVIESSQD